MATYTYTLTHGDAGTVGHDYSGVHACAADVARELASGSGAEVRVWVGGDRAGQPDAVLRRRTRQAAAS